MTADSSSEAIQTEVGADGGDLRYWLAKEALRQSEARLAGQSATIQAMETRATALLTWSVTLGVALVAAAVDPRFRWPAFGALLFALVTAVTSVMALWPRGWFSGGHRPSELDRLNLTTELEFLEHMAVGNEEAAERNESRLRTFARHIRLCWLSLAAAPMAAAILVAVALARP